MIVRYENYLGISHAEITTGKVTLLAGPNEQGKSCAVYGIAAAIAGEVIPPVEGLSSKTIGRVVKAGNKSGSVIVDNATGVIGVNYPKGEVVSEGAPLQISKYAAGVKSPLDEPVKSRGNVFVEALDAAPNEQEITHRLIGIDIPADEVKSIVSTIKVRGWDAALTVYQEKKSRLTGAWQQLAREQYGSVKSPAWLPPGWESDLAGATAEQLGQVVQQETQWLEIAISDAAINDLEKARLRELAGNVPHWRAQIAQIETAVHALRKNRIDISNGLHTMPQPVQPATCKCPHCQGDLIISGTVVEKATILTQEELDRRAAAIKQARESLQAVEQQLEIEEATLSSAKNNLICCEQAAKDLAVMESRRASGEGRTVEECRARAERAKSRLQAFGQKAESDRINAEIERVQIIIDELAPDGLRRDKLGKALTMFNQTLSQTCTLAGWPVVVVNEDMSVSYRDLPFVFASKSGRWRIRVALQISIALYQRAPVILLDEADILDDPGRNGLFGLLLKCPFSTVVSMTISKREKLPKLPDGCRVYWIENGTAVEA